MTTRSSTCVFCAIVAKELPAKLLYETDDVVAFPDSAPRAAVHILVVPKKHVPTILDLAPEDATLVSHLVDAVQHLVRERNLDRSAYRVVVNGGYYQHVPHLHWHIESPG
jgi:histidine triad (HIT) family protein